MNDREGLTPKELMDFSLEAVKSAGDIALRYYGKGNPHVKFDAELVTAAELSLTEHFRSRLRGQFPEHLVFGEEDLKTRYAHGQKGYLWVHDPVDGVANYQAGIPLWGISLALLENFWPVLGVFYMPVTSDIFFALAGGTAYYCDQAITIPDQPEVNNESLLFTYSRFNDHYHTTFPGKIRNLGCTAAHLCYVACGRAEAALLAHVSYQDLAAAQMILEAAGGEIRKVDGGKFHLNDHVDGSPIEDHLVAAARGRHDTIRDYLKEKV